MIGPKVPKLTKAQERAAYDAVTMRDPVCVRCGRHGIQRDHRKNRSQGGRTVPSNLQGLCHICHTWKTTSPADAVVEGFAVPGWAHPDLWPGYRVGVGWVVYFDSPVEGLWWREISESTATLLMDGGRDESHDDR